jgi:hypothetical protein
MYLVRQTWQKVLQPWCGLASLAAAGATAAATALSQWDMRLQVLLTVVTPGE